MHMFSPLGVTDSYLYSIFILTQALMAAVSTRTYLFYTWVQKENVVSA